MTSHSSSEREAAADKVSKNTCTLSENYIRKH